MKSSTIDDLERVPRALLEALRDHLLCSTIQVRESLALMIIVYQPSDLGLTTAVRQRG